MYLIAALMLFLFPLLTPLILIVLCPAIFSTRVVAVPLRLPIEANIPDPNDPLPGGDGFHKARGTVYLGNERFSKKEAWVSWNDQRLHDYILGTTGSGKTETILAINANYVLAGSGFLIGDGKGTMMFPKQTATLARLAGADDDHFVISFLSGYKDSYDRTHKKRSNSINPFGEGNAATVKELLTSLMSEGGGDNAIFADGAASLADSLAPAWVEGRDKSLFEFDITYISQSLALAQVYELSQLDKLSNLSRTHIQNYLANLGYDFEKPPNTQPENCTRMHGYYVNYFMRVVTSFAISYRHIYMCKQGEVNLRDCVQSHRCLTFTLPSLEKSGDEVSTLGKTILVAAKAASSFGLGESMEGTREEAVENLPANYPIPYKFNFDEFSFYVIKNMSLLPAQLRGINISCLMGAQDFIGTERAGEIDAESILANARTKCFGGLEDVKTWTKLRELVSEVDMLTFSRFTNKGVFGNRFIPDMDVQHTRRCPLEISELQQQVEGQFHVLQRGKVSKLKTYYPNITQDNVMDNYHLIRLVETLLPSKTQLTSLTLVRDFISILASRDSVVKPNKLSILAKNDTSSCADQVAIANLADFARKSRFDLSTSVERKRQENQQAPEQNAQDHERESTDTNTDNAEAPVYEDGGNHQEELENIIDEWSEAFVEESTDDETEAEAEADDLYRQTTDNAESFYDTYEGTSTDGVYALTDTECDAIEKRYQLLGLLLGEEQHEAKVSAAKIVDDIRKKVFYLIPPKPNSDNDIQAKVAALMKQTDLFDKSI